jgi:hypothetical protein
MVSGSAAVQLLYAAQRLPEAARTIDSVLQRHQAAATVGSWHVRACDRTSAASDCTADTANVDADVYTAAGHTQYTVAEDVSKQLH